MIIFSQPWQIYAAGVGVAVVLLGFMLLALKWDIERYRNARHERFSAYDAQQARLRAEEEATWRTR